MSSQPAFNLFRLKKALTEWALVPLRFYYVSAAVVPAGHILLVVPLLCHDTATALQQPPLLARHHAIMAQVKYLGVSDYRHQNKFLLISLKFISSLWQ